MATRVALGCDHAGFELKEAVREVLRAKGMSVVDLGTSSREAVDYPDIAVVVAGAVARGSAELGILLCGTGVGMSIAANKVAGVRAALCADSFTARMAREHNDANVLCLGSRVLGPGLAQDIVSAFLEARFASERHLRRVQKIRAIEAPPAPDGQI